MGLLLLIPAVANVVVWREAFNSSDGRLHMTVLDVSDGSDLGDGVLIQTPTGRYVLINGGPSSTRLSDQLGRQLPPLHCRIDFLVVAASSKEQLAALPDAIEGFSPQSVLWAGPTAAEANARRLRERLNAAGVPIIAARSGQVLDLGTGARLHVLAAGKRGAIFCLEWRNFRSILPVGANFDELEYLEYGREVGPVTALLLSENGAPSANPPEWIYSLNPQVILLNVAAGNRFDLPSPEVLQAVQGYNLVRTDQNGWIHLATDGEDLWVELERK